MMITKTDYLHTSVNVKKIGGISLIVLKSKQKLLFKVCVFWVLEYYLLFIFY